MWEHPREQKEAAELASALVRSPQFEEQRELRTWGGGLVRVMEPTVVRSRIVTRTASYDEIASVPAALATDVVLGHWDGEV